MRSDTNLELRESNPDGTGGAGLSHTAGGMFLLHTLEIAEEGEPRGGVTVVHDLGDHGGRYEQFAEFLSKAGWAVSLPDMRGHGSSEGARGHCLGMPEIVRDLNDTQDHLTIFAPGIPLGLIGQGLGGLQVLNYLIENPGRVLGAVVLSPTLSPSFDLPVKKGGLGGLFKKVKPESEGSIGNTPAKMTSVESEQKALSADAMVHDIVTVRSGEVATQAAQNVRARASEISVPVLILHGADDEIAKVADSQALAGGNIEVRVINGARHDLLHESGTQELQAEILEWLEQNIKF